jgi:hypothetical protein
VATSLIGAGCLNRGEPGTRLLTTLAQPALGELLRALDLERIEIVRPVTRPGPWLALDRGAPADLIAGGPWWSYALRWGAATLGEAWSARAGDRAGGWLAWRPRAVGLWVDESAASVAAKASSLWAIAENDDLVGHLSWTDPRVDGPLLTAAARHLDAGWSAGYADLVRWAAAARPARDLPLSTAWRDKPAAYWGDADSGPGIDRFVFVPSGEAGTWLQGVAIAPGARDPGKLQAALSAIAASTRPERAVERTGASTTRVAESAWGMSLLADLLDATLVVAKPELRTAWTALRQTPAADKPVFDRARQWVLQPPPWPPASVELLKTRPRAAALLNELTAQLTSTPASREGLRALFERAPGLLDGTILGTLAACDGGRLVRESRFRTWLRAEWAAWACQRYRRAVRLIEGKAGPP